MSKYTHAVEKIRNHVGFMSQEQFEQEYLFKDPASMASFITQNGCLITLRHDLSEQFTGTDFLVNYMTEIVVLHVGVDGSNSLHHWEKSQPCHEQNRLCLDKEAFLLDLLTHLEEV